MSKTIYEITINTERCQDVEGFFRRNYNYRDGARAEADCAWELHELARKFADRMTALESDMDACFSYRYPDSDGGEASKPILDLESDMAEAWASQYGGDPTIRVRVELVSGEEPESVEGRVLTQADLDAIEAQRTVQARRTARTAARAARRKRNRNS